MGSIQGHNCKDFFALVGCCLGSGSGGGFTVSNQSVFVLSLWALHPS